MFVAALSSATAQNNNNDLLVEMPVVPKDITLLDQRCNYIIAHY